MQSVQLQQFFQFIWSTLYICDERILHDESFDIDLGLDLDLESPASYDHDLHV